MTTQQVPPLRIAVIGGGIAGLSAAVSLQKLQANGANVEVKVYESAREFKEIGAGVAFGPNAQRALKLAGCEQVLADCAEGNDSSTSGAIDQNTWFSLTAGDKDHPRCGEIVHKVKGQGAAEGNVHRADFLDGLVKQFPKDLSFFNHRCVSYESHSKGVTLCFTQDHEEKVTAIVEADVVIAADGIKSLVRKHLYNRQNLPLEEQNAIYSEWVAYRGMIPTSKYIEIFGDLPHNMMFFGLDRHILTFPVRHGTFINIVGFVRDPQHEKLGGRSGPWSENRPLEELLKDYSTFSDKCLEMLRAIETPSIWGIFELPTLKSSVDEKTVLIGDACHATTPHQGSGAGQAVEDALFISHLLADSSVSTAPLSLRSHQVQRALDVYGRFRHVRGNKVVRTSREAGLLYQFRGIDGEGSDMEQIAENLQDRMQWIWNYDIAAELKKALDQLHA